MGTAVSVLPLGQEVKRQRRSGGAGTTEEGGGGGGGRRRGRGDERTFFNFSYIRDIFNKNLAITSPTFHAQTARDVE